MHCGLGSRAGPLVPWSRAGRDRPARRDRDLTVKGSRHLTFHITVKLTIKEEMLNLTCRQTFSFTQARPDSVWLKAAHAVEEAATRGPCQHPGSRSSALRYYASAAQDMHSRACGVCMPEAAAGWCQKPHSGPRVTRERLPSFRARTCVRSSRASCDDSVFRVCLTSVLT